MRMWTTAMLAACCLLGTPATHAGQRSETQVAVIRDGDSELERTAHRLKIPKEQLEQARIALQEATRLLHQLEVERIGEGRQIPSFWLRLHRRQAVQSLEALLTARSGEVPGLEKGARYERLLRWAVEVASNIADLDPSSGLQALQAWPAPYEWMGESAAVLFDRLQSEMASQGFSERFSQDAAQAIRELLHSSNSPNRYMSRLSRIRQAQDSQQANQFIDDILTDLRQSTDSNQLQGWTNLARRAGGLPHDRHRELMEAVILANSRAEPGPSAGQTYIYQVSGKEVALDWKEYRMIRSLRSFLDQPQALVEILNEWPEVQQAVDRLGGLDSSLRVRPVAMQQAGQESPQDNRTSRQARADAQALFQELKANTFSRPWWVRQRLNAIGDGEEGYQQLLGLMRSSQRRFPELAELVAERMRPMLEEDEDLAMRLKRFTSFGQLWARLEGRLPADFIQQGFHLLDEVAKGQQEGKIPLRDSRTEAGPSQSRLRSVASQASQLESFLIAEWSLNDFQSAMNEVGRQEDQSRRLHMLTAMIRRLGGQASSVR